MIDFAATATETISNGGILAAFIGLGYAAIRMVEKAIETRRAKRHDSDRPPAINHGPCNEAVNSLADTIREDAKDRKAEHTEEIKEQQAFRLAFEKYLAKEDGRREAQQGRQATGEHPVPT